MGLSVLWSIENSGVGEYIPRVPDEDGITLFCALYPDLPGVQGQWDFNGQRDFSWVCGVVLLYLAEERNCREDILCGLQRV